jgi:diguanylate cyclase (GGDEF)-like protein
MSVEVAPAGTPQKVEVRVSIGVAAARPGSEPLEVLEAADRALYQAKEMGRDQVRLAPG